MVSWLASTLSRGLESTRTTPTWSVVLAIHLGANCDVNAFFYPVPGHDGFPAVSSTDVQPNVQPCYS
jgi:hypothetical protein